jgi:hypothetical protein
MSYDFKFLRCYCVKHKQEKMLKKLRYLPFVFKLFYNGEEKTTILAVMLFHQGIQIALASIIVRAIDLFRP